MIRGSSRRHALPALVALVVLALVGSSGSAAAQDAPAGSVTAHLLASPSADLGGALGADLWLPLGVFRIGGFLGVAATPSGEDERNRIFMPLAASVGIELLGEVVGFSLRARGGLWGGATQDVKLTAGGFVGGGAYLLFNLGAGVGLGVGMDVWGLLGEGDGALFAPGVGLTWNPTTIR